MRLATVQALTKLRAGDAVKPLIERLADEELRRVRNEIARALFTTTGGNLYDDLEQALLDPEVDTLLLLSDGVPGAGRYTSTGDILRAIRRVNQTRRVVIHCVSLGRDSDLLRRLAAENGGTYVWR